MAGEQTSAGSGVTDPAQTIIEKGKGKAADTPQDVSMGEDEDDSSDEETGAEEDVSPSVINSYAKDDADPDRRNLNVCRRNRTLASLSR